jgi:hypothetical protein
MANRSQRRAARSRSLRRSLSRCSYRSFMPCGAGSPRARTSSRRTRAAGCPSRSG